MITNGQKLALDQLRKISEEAKDEFEIERVGSEPDKYGWLEVEISINCGNFLKADGGLPLCQREKLIIYVPPNFPFSIPRVFTTHYRFDGYPHVQWKKSLCIYQSTEVEWNSNDGMFGFIARLVEWLQKGALNELDPSGGPLHPPVAYVKDKTNEVFIPQKNTPAFDGDCWYGLAKLEEINDKTIAITDWVDISAAIPTGYYAAVILLSSSFTFEFPKRASDLIGELEKRKVSLTNFLCILQAVQLFNSSKRTLFLVLGTKMRGIKGSEDLKQHITVWKIDELGQSSIDISTNKFSKDEVLKKIGEKGIDFFRRWLEIAEVQWCYVYEDREEIVIRRDYSTPVSSFKNKTIAIWGCGALGANAAIFLARAGVKKLILRDSKAITPGVLVRQPYRYKDIGKLKTDALREIIHEINPGIIVESINSDIKELLLSKTEWIDNVDLIIDCTASNLVHYAIEKVLANGAKMLCPMISMIIDRYCTNGIVIAIGQNYSGGPYDVFRKAILEGCKNEDLYEYICSFIKKGNTSFQPIPGCSDPTFIGSAVDVAGLTSIMLNFGTDIFSTSPVTASAWFIHKYDSNNKKVVPYLVWDSDNKCNDLILGYEIRVSMLAWSQISQIIKLSKSTKETGGLLFGYRDDVLKVIWVDEVSGPPPDSIASIKSFVCGIVGTKELNELKAKNTFNKTKYIGMWHTHPGSEPYPSLIDIYGMERILHSADFNREKNLLLIIHPRKLKHQLGAYLFDKKNFENHKKIKCDERFLASFFPKENLAKEQNSLLVYKRNRGVKMRKLNFYEFVGIFLPGAIVILSLSFYFPKLNSILLQNQNQFSTLSFFLIMSYAIGHLLQSIGNLIELVWWKIRGGWPTDWISKKDVFYPTAWKETIIKEFSRENCQPFENIYTWRNCVRVIYAEVKSASRSERIDIFNGNYGLHRGIASSLFTSAVILLFFKDFDLKTIIVFLILIFAAIFRMDLFARHYAKELFVQFYLLKR